MIIPLFWWIFEFGYSGLHSFRAVLALFVRFSLIALFIMLLAEPRAVIKNNRLSVMYLLDVSDSIGKKAVNQGLDYIAKTVQGRPEGDRAGLIVFGRDSAVELPPRESFPLEAINSTIQRDGTDLGKALLLAEAMLPSDENGKIVIISDGRETQGNYRDAIRGLRVRKIVVDVLPIDYSFNNEVWLEKLELPRFIKKEETYEASVILSSMKAGVGILTLEENGEEIFSKEVIFQAGKNSYTLPIYLRRSGYFEYTAKIKVPRANDGWLKNNIAMNSVYLKGKGKVLMVIDSVGEERDWKSPLNALRESGFSVDVKDAFDCPRDQMSLMPYDCVIFANVAADAFDAVQLRAINRAVYNQGTGFLMIGGKNSFGPGGYNRTPIEELLPVNMDVSNKKVLPKAALVIILHTCEFEDGNSWAKKIAKSAIKVMGAKDEVGVLAYASQGDQWIFPLTPAGEYDKLVKIINKCNPGDMPSFSKTMEMGLKGLNASDAATKHMIIISDGDPAPPPPELINKFVASKISISTVLVDGFHQGSFQKFMRIMASHTGGRFYYPQNPSLLPSIFIKEAKTLKRSMIQNKTFIPVIDFNDGNYLKGIDKLPQLNGYVLTSAKNDIRRCRVILRGPDKDQLDPLLAVGQFGIGKTAAFTSDLSTNWGKNWVTWSKYQPFIKQLILSISRISKKNNLKIRTASSGDSGVVVVEDFHPDTHFLDMGAEVKGPNNRSINIDLLQEGSKRYKGNFKLWGKGRYEIVAIAIGEGREERVVGSFVVPYSAEYLNFSSNPLILREIAEITKGKILTGNETGKEIFPAIREERENSNPIFNIFLIIIAILIPLDVGVRRIQIDFGAILAYYKKSSKKGTSTKTLGALLKRKEGVDTQLKDNQTKISKDKIGKNRLNIIDSSTQSSSEKNKKNVSKQEEVVEKSKEGEVSTTGRLLANKRKKNKKNDFLKLIDIWQFKCKIIELQEHNYLQ